MTNTALDRITLDYAMHATGDGGVDIMVEHRSHKAVASLNRAIERHKVRIATARKGHTQTAGPFERHEMRRAVAESCKHIRICRSNRAGWAPAINMDASECKS